MSLQGLAEALFQFYAISSADARKVATFENELKFTMRDGLKFQDAVDVDDNRSMNANETPWIEARSQFHLQ